MSDFGWCFIGAGHIARSVAQDCPGLRIASVCARHLDRAQAFADQFGGAAFDDLEKAVNAPGVDGVYVTTQHPEHSACAMAAMRMGKPVLCEKPMSIDAASTRAMIDCAKAEHVFLAEAMWPRHNPVLKTALTWIRTGEIGALRYMNVDFSEFVPDSHDYMFKPDRAGGALLDMGIYPLAMAQMVFGRNPSDTLAYTDLSDGGVDLRISALLRYPDGGVASIFTAIDTHSTFHCSIHGTAGTIDLPNYWHATEATLTRLDGTTLSVRRDGCFGYALQMSEIEREIRAGLLESPEIPLADTLALAVQMEKLRRDAGVLGMPPAKAD